MFASIFFGLGSLSVGCARGVSSLAAIVAAVRRLLVYSQQGQGWFFVFGVVFKGFLFEPSFMWQPISPCNFFPTQAY
jgi:hypothetical protein